MDRYVKYPKVSYVYGTINKLEKNIKKNKVELRETNDLILDKKHDLRSIKSRFTKIKKDKLKEIQDEFNVQLLNAKYQKQNIKKMFLDYEIKKAKLIKEYQEKIINRSNTLTNEINSITSANKSLKDKNKEMKLKLKASKRLLKEYWNETKGEREVNEKQLLESLRESKKSSKENILKFKLEFKEQYKNLIDEFKANNPELKLSWWKIRKFASKRVSNFKSEAEESLYDLTVKINTLKIVLRNKTLFQKSKINNIKLELRYNKGKTGAITFKTFVNKTTLFSGKILNWKILVALRNGFFSLMPLVIIGALFILINNILLSASNGGLFSLFSLSIDQLQVLKNLQDIGNNIWNGTYAFFAFMLAGSIAYHLAPFYKVNQWSSAVVGMGSFLAMNPLFVKDLSSFGTTGMFTSIVVSILSTIIFGKISKNKKLKIKMPKSVPEGVSKSFNVLIPYAFTMMTFGFTAFVITQVGIFVGPVYVIQGKPPISFSTINELIVILIQKPLVHAVSGLGGMIVIVLLWQVLWFLGIHAGGVLSPIIEPIQLAGISENQNAVASGGIPSYVFTNPFMNNFIHIGGTGGTFGLILAIFIFSKRVDYRFMAKVTLVPSIFCVNEPLLFGLPVVLNPVLFIPFILAPLLAGLIAYISTVTGIMNYSSVIVPWTTPPVLGGLLTTKDLWGAVVAFVNIGVLFGVYSPFVILANLVEKKSVLNKFGSLESQKVVIPDRKNIEYS